MRLGRPGLAAQMEMEETTEDSLFQPVAKSGPLCQLAHRRHECNSLPTVLLSSGLC